MSGSRSRNAVLEDLRSVAARDKRIGVSSFRNDGTLSSNSTGVRSNVAEFTANTPNAIRQGDANPFYIAIPAYETETMPSADTSDQTVSLSNSVVRAPITEDVVLYLDGERSQGNIANVDYSADEVTVSHDNTGQEADLFYVSDDAATIEVEKEAPQTEGTVNEKLFEGSLNLIHVTDQAAEPETYHLDRSAVQSVLASEWKLVVYVDAPYDISWSVSRTSGDAQPDNAVLSTPVRVAPREIPGLPGLVREDVAGR